MFVVSHIFFVQLFFRKVFRIGFSCLSFSYSVFRVSVFRATALHNMYKVPSVRNAHRQAQRGTPHRGQADLMELRISAHV